VLEWLKGNKKIANATHNIYAYRISSGKESFIQDCEDDGETQAGGRILHLLQVRNSTETCRETSVVFLVKCLLTVLASFTSWLS